MAKQTATETAKATSKTATTKNVNVADADKKLRAAQKAAKLERRSLKAKQVATKKAAKATEPKEATLGIHVNRTGRVCFGKLATERIGQVEFMMLTAKDGKVRFQPLAKYADGAHPVRWAGNRPYVSATSILKELGFDGSKGLDFIAAPTGSNALEIRWK